MKRKYLASVGVIEEAAEIKYISSCSFGKDSLATVLLALKHKEPLDEVIYCEVMFDKNISGEIPEHRDFIYNIAIPRLESEGVKITVLRSETTYSDCFTKTTGERSTRAGMIWGFPLAGRCWANGRLKTSSIKKWLKVQPDFIQYIGIAYDEKRRLLKLDGVQKISLLNKYKVTESMAFEICKQEDLLSPMYEFTKRGGCWFCPNAKEKELRHLYDNHKHLWQKMLELQALPNKATELFNRTMKFSQIDYKFRMEDAQVILF